MNWDALGASGEVIGATAVILTLFYLGRQISHSVDLTRTSQRQTLMNSYAAYNELVLQSPELMNFLQKMEKSDVDIAEDETVIARHYIYRLCNIYNSAQAAFDTKLITPEEFGFFQNAILVQTNEYPGLKKAMVRSISNFPDATNWLIYKDVMAEAWDARPTSVGA